MAVDLQKTWLVTVEFLTGKRAGEVVEFRWFKRSDALRCKRDFASPKGVNVSKVSMRECVGRNTFSGWVDV